MDGELHLGTQKKESDLQGVAQRGLLGGSAEVWGSMRNSERCKMRSAERRKSISSLITGKGMWRGQWIQRTFGKGNLWGYLEHEGQSMMGLGRWERKVRGNAGAAHKGMHVVLGNFERLCLVPRNVIPCPWGLPVGKIVKTSEDGSCLVDRSLDVTRSAFEPRKGSGWRRQRGFPVDGRDPECFCLLPFLHASQPSLCV